MLKNIKHKISAVLFCLGLLVSLPVSHVAAQGAGGSASNTSGGGSCNITITFFPAWYDGLCDGKGGIKSPTDFSGDTGQQFGTWLTIIAMNIVRMLLYVVGYVSLIFIIWGGFKYMTQGDNSNGTAAARKTIQNAVIGLVISIMSVAIVTFVAGNIK